jgi:hypothetical protein
VSWRSGLVTIDSTMGPSSMRRFVLTICEGHWSLSTQSLTRLRRRCLAFSQADELKMPPNLKGRSQRQIREKCRKTSSVWQFLPQPYRTDLVPTDTKHPKYHAISKGKMVGVARIELATPAMSTQCSTTELYAHAARALTGAWPKRNPVNAARLF